MTSPQAPPQPQPLMPLLVSARPGAKPREIIIDEAEGERLMADIAARLVAIRAAKAAYADIIPPPPPAEEPAKAPVELCGVWRTDTGATCHLPAGHPGDHELTPRGADPLPPLDALPPIDAAYCGQRYFDGESWQECAEPPHEGLHGDQGPQPDTRADDEPQENDGPCMADGCGHSPGAHAGVRGTGGLLFCTVCACRRYLSPRPGAGAPCAWHGGEGKSGGRCPECRREVGDRRADNAMAGGEAHVAPVAFLRHDQQTLAGVKLGGAS